MLWSWVRWLRVSNVETGGVWLHGDFVLHVSYFAVQHRPDPLFVHTGRTKLICSMLSQERASRDNRSGR
jgi:hypothetical protein